MCVIKVFGYNFGSRRDDWLINGSITVNHLKYDQDLAEHFCLQVVAVILMMAGVLLVMKPAVLFGSINSGIWNTAYTLC